MWEFQESYLTIPGHVRENDRTIVDRVNGSRVFFAIFLAPLCVGICLESLFPIPIDAMLRRLFPLLAISRECVGRCRPPHAFRLFKQRFRAQGVRGDSAGVTDDRLRPLFFDQLRVPALRRTFLPNEITRTGY